MKKKEFMDNPALAYMSNNKTKATNKTSNSETIKYKLNPKYIETKSKRVQLLMQPTLFNALKEYAQQHNTSINETVCLILKDFLHIEI